MNLRRPAARVLVVAAVLTALPAAHASFHEMQIEQIIGGVDGDPSAQAIQLRLRDVGENLVHQGRLVAYDATGSNPVVLIDFSTDVPHGNGGDRILIASASFPQHTSPAATGDFTFTNLIPAGYLAAGRITYESDFGPILWSVSYGGAAYTGATTGDLTNDPDGQFGPSCPGPLPATGLTALQFQGAAATASANNAADYAVTAGAATFVNNAGASFTLGATASPITAAFSKVKAKCKDKAGVTTCQLSATLTVTNTSDSPSTSLHGRFFLSADAAFDAETAVPLGEGDTGVIKPHKSFKKKLKTSLETTPSGKFLLAVADDDTVLASAPLP